MAVQLIAVAGGLGAAAGFAVSTSMQHRAAASAPEGSAAALIGYLVRRPAWLLGMLSGAVAFGLHALAVREGALALVQPLIVSGMVFAIPVRAALDRQRPSIRNVIWAGVTAAGIVCLVLAAGSGGDLFVSAAVNHTTAGLFVCFGAAVAATCSATARGSLPGWRRGLLLGLAAGILFGLVGGVLKLSVLALTANAQLAVWPVAAVVVIGAWGLTLNQRSYQVAPLSVSMPMLNGVAVVVAIAFGWVVLGEVPDLQPGTVLAGLLGLALMAIGLRGLARAAAISGGGDQLPATVAGAGLRSSV